MEPLDSIGDIAARVRESERSPGMEELFGLITLSEALAN